ncbi:MAG: FHA domain-containing protein, partial [Chloroflexi bacterium]|nr:FHA domain-containing protein [Chloroflexota bacterium]
MNRQLPYLEVTGPDGQVFEVELTKERLTIGRLVQFNDISLEPDPQQLVTRMIHCALERTSSGWWVVDNGSVNRTFVQWDETMKVVNGREPISDGAAICILGRLSESGEPVYWQLHFHDPLQTRQLRAIPQEDHLEYDWLQAKLFRVSGRTREEVDNLRPQEHKLIRYMDQRN